MTTSAEKGRETMTTVAQILKMLSDKLDKVAVWISILYAFLVTVVVLSSVFLRMAGHAPSWSEEFARWMLVGIAFISASIALKRGGHIGITAIVKSIRIIWLNKLIIQISNILVLIFLVYVFWFGLDAAIQAADQMGDIIPFSMLYIKLHIPLGVAIMIVHVLYYIIGIMRTHEPEKFLLSQ
ncbi:TRAP transporter small permease subunit [candidate division KSB3 bacterium]|uniref:TRAP transporter small permease subunit n=1 Tax=candidate division KSB3 bacterium TaxID=2044937 RepID=A0A9D5JTP8_9BACT|nr:TRAP transporter small permease subunit [candidate division KSB3 bacterium]MBD3323486.1 TRAP transporter small permease subunit [candidate division KSB3 bacterium]